MWPEDGAGEVKVVLTQESALVLPKIPEMRRWQVQPTMTRGAKAAAKKFAEMKEVKPKAKSGPTSKVRKHRTKKDAKISQVMPLLDEENPSMFRRTPQGRERIRMMMEDLLKLDQKVFPKSPVFDEEGTCRMKFQGADMYNWSGVLDNAGGAFEHMRPDSGMCEHFVDTQRVTSHSVAFTMVDMLSIFRIYADYFPLHRSVDFQERAQSSCSLSDLHSPYPCI